MSDRLRVAVKAWSDFWSDFPRRVAGFTGQMAEWLKAPVWRTGRPHKGLEGSNPSLSVSPTAFEYRPKADVRLGASSCPWVPAASASPICGFCQILGVFAGL
jgi:hypothetical protein